MKEYILDCENDTIKLAEEIAGCVDKQSIILLYGDLGAGKTFFSKAFINFFAKAENRTEENVISPTFNIVKTYNTKNFTIFHFDLYRIKHQSEVFELDLDEAFSNVSLIEWPEIIEDILPYKTFVLHFKLEDGKRSCIVENYK